MNKFRGKCINTNQWVYGNICYLNDGIFILEKDQSAIIDEPDYHSHGMGCGLEDRNITDRYEAMLHGWEKAIERQREMLPNFIPVIPESVSQFTGEIDIDNNEIYNGDILNINRYPFFSNDQNNYIAIVIWYGGAWQILTKVINNDVRGISDGNIGKLVSPENIDNIKVIDNSFDNLKSYIKK